MFTAKDALYQSMAYTDKKTGGSPTPTETSLNDLTDVSISDVSDGQVLSYDSANNEWKNSSIPTPTPTSNSKPYIVIKAQLLSDNSYELVDGSLTIASHINVDLVGGTEATYTVDENYTNQDGSIKYGAFASILNDHGGFCGALIIRYSYNDYTGEYVYDGYSVLDPCGIYAYTSEYEGGEPKLPYLDCCGFYRGVFADDSHEWLERKFGVYAKQVGGDIVYIAYLYQ